MAIDSPPLAGPITPPTGPLTGPLTERGSPLREPQTLSAGLRTRRAVCLVALTLLVPGSAQLAAGSRRVGRIALRVWLTLVAVLGVLVALWLVDRTIVLRLVTSPVVLALVTVALFAAALAWPALVVDAWRLGRPVLLARRTRLALSGLMVTCVLLTSLPLIAAGRRSWAAADLIGGVFGSGRTSSVAGGRYNVLLLGGDAGPDRVGTRPDSVTLASIDADTGRTVLLSLPRNLEDIPFAPGSPAAKAMPGGWSCGDTCLLNAIYTWGSEHQRLFPGVRDPGAEAMKEAVEGVTGLKVNYYVLIDLMGFRQLIDAMGGIEITVTQRVPIGGGTSKVSGYIEPGTQRLDGYHALWFARSRHGASDYARMERQRCVMNAMAHQMDAATLLNNFQAIAAASKRVVSTDVPAGELANLIELATKGKSQKITSVQFVPPLVNPAHPDFAVIRSRVSEAIAQSRQSTQPDRHPASAPPPRTTTSTATAAATAPGAAVDISSVCSAA